MPEATTPMPTQRRRGEVPHPELLAPIEFPADDEARVLISMSLYRHFERFHHVLADAELAVARGRLEGKCQAYQMVLDQVRANEVLSSVRQPVLTEHLGRILAACQADLQRLESMSAAPLPQNPEGPLPQNSQGPPPAAGGV